MTRIALVVDDSPSVRQLVGHTLRQAGFEVIEGTDGKDGLAHLAHEHVDLVITDLNMPEMNGLELVTRLRGLRQYRFTPVLMLTTENGDARKQAGRAAGATGWITKPFDPKQLLQVIARVLA